MKILLKTSMVLGALLMLEGSQPAKAATIEPIGPVAKQTNILDAQWRHHHHYRPYYYYDDYYYNDYYYRDRGPEFRFRIF